MTLNFKYFIKRLKSIPKFVILLIIIISLIITFLVSSLLYYTSLKNEEFYKNIAACESYRVKTSDVIKSGIYNTKNDSKLKVDLKTISNLEKGVPKFSTSVGNFYYGCTFEQEAVYDLIYNDKIINSKFVNRHDNANINKISFQDDITHRLIDSNTKVNIMDKFNRFLTDFETINYENFNLIQTRYNQQFSIITHQNDAFALDDIYFYYQSPFSINSHEIINIENDNSKIYITYSNSLFKTWQDVESNINNYENFNKVWNNTELKVCYVKNLSTMQLDICPEDNILKFPKIDKF